MNGNKAPVILVTDANLGSAVTIIRSLGRAGWNVVAADSNPGAIGFSSTYAREKAVYPDPKTEPERFIVVLLELARRYSVDLILPVTDVVMQPLMNERDSFRHVCMLGIPDYMAYETVTDKSRTLALATRLGIPIPATTRVSNLQDLEHIIDQLNFPLVVKPESSVKICDNGKYRSFRVSYANNIESLRRIIAELDGDVSVLLQEYSAGEGYGIEIVANSGKCLCVFGHRRLAEVPISGGASAWRESIRPDAELLSYAESLVSELKWTGPIMVEFKVGERVSLMEINGRVWGSLPLATYAGVDFPRIWAEIYLGRSSPEQKCDYPLGIRAYNPELMAIWLINVLLGRVRYPYLPYPQRGEALKGICALFSRNNHSDLACKDDPLPWKLQRSKIIGKVFRKIQGELSTASEVTSHHKSY